MEEGTVKGVFYFYVAMVFVVSGCSGISPNITITDTYSRTGSGPKILPEWNACSGAAKLLGEPKDATYRARGQFVAKYQNERREQKIDIKKKTKCRW
jgi:hypothetical protein